MPLNQRPYLIGRAGQLRLPIEECWQRVEVRKLTDQQTTEFGFLALLSPSRPVQIQTDECAPLVEQYNRVLGQLQGLE